MLVGNQNQFGEMLLVNILKVKKMYVNSSTWNEWLGELLEEKKD